MSLGLGCGAHFDPWNFDSDWDACGYVLVEPIDEDIGAGEIIIDVQITIGCFPLVEGIKVTVNAGAH